MKKIILADIEKIQMSQLDLGCNLAGALWVVT